MNWKEKLEKGQVSEAVKRLNPHLFVGGLANPVRKQHSIQTLDGRQTIQPRLKTGVAVIVTIVSFRSKEIDDDNLTSGAKCLRDCIARSLALDDGDKRIKWEYDQVITKGKPGTQVSLTCK